MMKRYMAVSVLCVFVGCLGCRAFNSSYGSHEADLASQPAPKKPEASSSKPLVPSPNPSEAAPIDYTKDTTICKTPDGVIVGKNPGKLMSSAGWVNPVDGEQVTVVAVKKGFYSATITIQKTAADKSSSQLSFTVKQTAADKFEACGFNYSEGKDRLYPGVSGTVMVDQVNAADSKTGTITNSGSFMLTFTRSAAVTATKVQSIYLGATTPAAPSAGGPILDGSYFVDALTETPAK